MDKKHLFVTDLDGTLLNADSKVSQESAEIISSLSREGALITVATARTPATVEPLLCETATSIPAIVMTGAAMWDRKEKRYIAPAFVTSETITDIMPLFARNKINPFIYVLPAEGSVMTVYHNGILTNAEQRFVDDRRGLQLKHFCLDSTRCAEYPIPGTILIFAMGPRDRLDPVARQLKTDKRCSVSYYNDIFNHDLAYIEIFGPGVSKAAAVKRLADSLGATGITVYGDNLNDLSMMQIADEGVAVANAVPELIAAATRTIGPNTESSVARDIMRQIKIHS